MPFNNDSTVDIAAQTLANTELSEGNATQEQVDKLSNAAFSIKEAYSLGVLSLTNILSLSRSSAELFVKLYKKSLSEGGVFDANASFEVVSKIQNQFQMKAFLSGKVTIDEAILLVPDTSESSRAKSEALNFPDITLDLAKKFTVFSQTTAMKIFLAQKDLVLKKQEKLISDLNKAISTFTQSLNDANTSLASAPADDVAGIQNNIDSYTRKISVLNVQATKANTDLEHINNTYSSIINKALLFKTSSQLENLEKLHYILNEDQKSDVSLYPVLVSAALHYNVIAVEAFAILRDFEKAKLFTTQDQINILKNLYYSIQEDYKNNKSDEVKAWEKYDLDKAKYQLSLLDGYTDAVLDDGDEAVLTEPTKPDFVDPRLSSTGFHLSDDVINRALNFSSAVEESKDLVGDVALMDS